MNKYAICKVFLVGSVMLHCITVYAATPVTVRFERVQSPSEITTPANFDVGIRNAKACYSKTSGPGMSALDASSRTEGHATNTLPVIGNPKRLCLAVSEHRSLAEPSKETVSATAGLAGNSSPASSSLPMSSPTSAPGRAVHIPVPSVSSVSQVLYLHTDVLGSVVAESDGSGQLKTSTQYKPFGEVVNN